MVFSSRGDRDRSRLGDQQTLDFRDARAALRTAAQFLFQTLQVQSPGDTGANRALADVLAIAWGLSPAADAPA
jgi:hypothetical protein